jgi:hypothetical protein
VSLESKTNSPGAEPVFGEGDHLAGLFGFGEGRGVERGDPDGVGDELGLDVQDLLTGVDLAQWEPGGDNPVGFLGIVQVGFRCA